jgi:hypothetical protein
MTYDQNRAELTVLVLEAMRTVALSPRHEPAPPPEPRRKSAPAKGGKAKRR